MLDGIGVRVYWTAHLAALSRHEATEGCSALQQVDGTLGRVLMQGLPNC